MRKLTWSVIIVGFAVLSHTAIEGSIVSVVGAFLVGAILLHEINQ